MDCAASVGGEVIHSPLPLVSMNGIVFVAAFAYYTINRHVSLKSNEESKK